MIAEDGSDSGAGNPARILRPANLIEGVPGKNLVDRCRVRQSFPRF